MVKRRSNSLEFCKQNQRICTNENSTETERNEG